jgi:hypothetical protein
MIRRAAIGEIPPALAVASPSTLVRAATDFPQFDIFIEVNIKVGLGITFTEATSIGTGCCSDGAAGQFSCPPSNTAIVQSAYAPGKSPCIIIGCKPTVCVTASTFTKYFNICPHSRRKQKGSH